jgi:hypothetical protein
MMVNIICRGICGKSFLISISQEQLDNDLCDWFCQFHHLDMPKTDIRDYAISVKICNSYGSTIHMETKISDLVEKYGQTIYLRMLLKSFTMSHNFEFDTLSAECPITLENCYDPYTTTCCRNTFDKNTLMKLTNCPFCREPLHILKK